MDVKLGWRPDLPDVRDFHPEMLATNKKICKAALKQPTALPAKVDNRKWCSPIVDQLNIGSCTGNAGCAMYEYMENKAHNKFIRMSRLFLYKVTRNLAKETGDVGAQIRTTMQAMATFGICPEEYWAYNPAKFDVEPTQFCYAFAQSYQALTYFRLDTPDCTKQELLRRIKEYLSRGYAIEFGFSVYDSLWRAAGGMIPFPTPSDRMQGGHAVLAVGYDDARRALLIKNSWGTQWGAGGYGWLPYAYVLQNLADDFWALTAAEWLDSGQFA